MATMEQTIDKVEFPAISEVKKKDSHSSIHIWSPHHHHHRQHLIKNVQFANRIDLSGEVDCEPPKKNGKKQNIDEEAEAEKIVFALGG